MRKQFFGAYLTLSSFLLSSQAIAGKGEAVPGEYLVKLRSRISTQKLQSFALKGFRIQKSIDPSTGLYLVRSDKNLTNHEFSTLDNSEIEIIEPNYIYKDFMGSKKPSPPPPQNDERARLSTVFPNDPRLVSLWGLANDGTKNPAGFGSTKGADVWAPEAWSLHKGSGEVVVAVVDGGAELSHPDLKDNFWVGEGGIHGYNAIEDNFNPEDDRGHGTHVAGTVGARGHNALGVVGVNWNVKIMPIKFSSQGKGSTAAAIRGIRWAVDHGAQVINASWGSYTKSQLLEEAIEYARSKNVLFVAAAGNDGTNNDKDPVYPASYQLDNVVAVAATDSNDKIAYFTNYGLKSVHVGAPGFAILSTSLDHGYAVMDGTSMAAPHVTGAAALLLSYKPNLSYKEVKAKILQSADKLPSLKGKVSSEGRLNLYKMLKQ